MKAGDRVVALFDYTSAVNLNISIHKDSVYIVIDTKQDYDGLNIKIDLTGNNGWWIVVSDGIKYFEKVFQQPKLSKKLSEELLDNPELPEFVPEEISTLHC